MEQSNRIDVEAPVKQVWEVLREVELWPEWAPTVTSVRRLDDEPFAVGSRVPVEQPVSERHETSGASVKGQAISGSIHLGAAPVGRRLSPCLSRMLRIAENDRSVSSTNSRNDRPAAYWSRTNRSTRAWTARSGCGLAVPTNSGSGFSCGRGG